MRFVKVKDEERQGEVAINLDLVREALWRGIAAPLFRA